MGKVPERRAFRKNARYQSISFTVEYPVSRTGESNAIRYSSPGNCVMFRIERDLAFQGPSGGPNRRPPLWDTVLLVSPKPVD
ncbi:hypothetical protein DQ04_13891000 [Trypanosoma grayi]|uniref:hypothetical protein n=1 Tax=Trypanosoma grayi TaxID=71804 RepID=UPI0004F443C4|nr:hypothetical protein DQ04_13891000 [Trypanosoma grayi]KEG06444.1 hypothetical protein DQ04_13891000 [Trypanosoma grayi]